MAAPVAALVSKHLGCKGGCIGPFGAVLLQGSLVIRNQDGPQNHAFPYVYTPYLVLNAIVPPWLHPFQSPGRHFRDGTNESCTRARGHAGRRKAYARTSGARPKRTQHRSKTVNRPPPGLHPNDRDERGFPRRLNESKNANNHKIMNTPTPPTHKFKATAKTPIQEYIFHKHTDRARPLYISPRHTTPHYTTPTPHRTWLHPCRRTVGASPLYSAPKPSSLTTTTAVWSTFRYLRWAIS